jgi:hypothetical protein
LGLEGLEKMSKFNRKLQIEKAILEGTPIPQEG